MNKFNLVMKTQIFILLILLGVFNTRIGWSNDNFFDQKTLDQTETINIYPNPLDQKGTIEIKLDNATEAKIEFYDLSGKKVKEFKETFLNEGQNKIEFRTADFKEGYYFCKVTTDQWVKTKRILVRR